MRLLPGALAAWFLCACGSKGEPVESTWQAQPEPSAEPPEMAVPTEGTPDPGAVSSTGERTESPRNPSSSSTTTPTGASAPPSASGSQTEVTAGREMTKNVGGGTGLESDAGAAVNGGSSNGESSDVGFPPVDEPSPAPPLGVSVEQPRAALPLPRQEHAVAALDGEIYLIGRRRPLAFRFTAQKAMNGGMSLIFLSRYITPMSQSWEESCMSWGTTRRRG